MANWLTSDGRMSKHVIIMQDASCLVFDNSLCHQDKTDWGQEWFLMYSIWFCDRVFDAFLIDQNDIM